MHVQLYITCYSIDNFKIGALTKYSFTLIEISMTVIQSILTHLA